MKKTQNTANTNQKSKLQSTTEKLSAGDRPKINLELRRANRQLETEKLLSLLRSETPNFFEIAEVVGKWVWIHPKAILVLPPSFCFLTKSLLHNPLDFPAVFAPIFTESNSAHKADWHIAESQR